MKDYRDRNWEMYRKSGEQEPIEPNARKAMWIFGGAAVVLWLAIEVLLSAAGVN